MSINKVEGTKKEHKVFLYALSTCGWCKKTKQLLNKNDVEYEYLDVDKCTSEERKQAISDIKSRNVPLGFPIIIIDDEKVISGYKESAIKEVLEI
jgi:glutaredoxin